MKNRLCRTDELNDSSYVKILLRPKAVLIMEKNDNYCFLRSLLASFHPCKNDLPNSVSNYKQQFDELNIEGFDFGNGFRCSDNLKFDKLNNLSLNVFELHFYQDKNNWNNNLTPIEISKNDESDRVVDSIKYKNLSALIEKLNVILGNHKQIFL